jgi:cell pole-organizing protein PopZ
MEEILASIRRIIADDQEGASSAAPAASRGAAASAPSAMDDDVLDLAEFNPPPAPIRPTLVAETAPEPEPVRPVAAPLPEFRLPDPEPEPVPAPVVAIRPSLSDFAPEPPAAPPPPRPAQAALAAEVEEQVEALVSHDAMASVGSAFSMLSHTILTQNARTLEDLVKDMLKPLLKAWLDDNLPPLVERLVRAEIERVARGGR